MIRHLARGTALYGGSNEQIAAIDNWVDLASVEIEACVNTWINPILGLVKTEEGQVKKAQHETKTIIGFIDTTLKSSEFLAGGELTIADLAVFAAFALPMKIVLDTKTLSSFKAFTAWFDKIKAMEQVVGVYGKIHNCRVA
jgi:glutathione S-transferase